MARIVIDFTLWILNKQKQNRLRIHVSPELPFSGLVLCMIFTESKFCRIYPLQDLAVEYIQFFLVFISFCHRCLWCLAQPIAQPQKKVRRQVASDAGRCLLWLPFAKVSGDPKNMETFLWKKKSMNRMKMVIHMFHMVIYIWWFIWFMDISSMTWKLLLDGLEGA